MHWLIIGCGYVGSRVARAVLQAGGRVSATTRSAERAAELQRLGIAPIVADLTRPETLAALPKADVWLHVVAPDRDSPLPRRALTVDALRDLLTLAGGRTKRLIHISTTSVYGTADGSWVDELSPCEPATEAGQLALEAEQLVAQFAARNGSRCLATILRPAGIYGPGRLIARIDQLRERVVLSGLAESWLNLIHVDDLLQVILRVADAERPDPLYLVSDDRPITRRDFYGEVARLMQTPLPCFAFTDNQAASPSEGAPAAVSNGRTQGLNKRCRNTKIREELGIELIYPTAYDGLPASIVASP
jgi:nucleoside-diphosphate-sugar epimerase